MCSSDLAIIVSSKQRLPYHPDLPTVREAGYDFDQESWFGLFAPAKTPRPIVERLRTEMKKITEDGEMRAFWEKSGGVPLNMVTHPSYTPELRFSLPQDRVLVEDSQTQVLYSSDVAQAWQFRAAFQAQRRFASRRSSTTRG